MRNSTLLQAAFGAALGLVPAVAGAGSAKGIVPPTPSRVAVLYAGRLIPIEQFSIAFADACLFFHLHAVNGATVTAFDQTVVPDPSPGSCGYGPAPGSVWVVYESALPDQDFDGVPDSLDLSPDDPDRDDDGIPDGSEDLDGDGLTTSEEIYRSGSDFTVADTDGNGQNDRIDFLVQETESGFTVIPVITNLYTGSGATEEHAADALAEANKVLRKTHIKLVPIMTRTNVTSGDDGSGGGTANDGRFTSEEGRKVRTAGIDEITSVPNRKGFKISFAAGGGVLTGSTTPGLSWHRQGSVLVTQRASPELTGSTIAHELIHVLTLGHPTGAVPENTPGNIMTPSNAGRDAFVNSADPMQGIENVAITPGQIAQITSDGVAQQLGLPSGRRSPARKREYESAHALDAVGDQTAGQPAHLDLTEIQIATDETRDDLHVLLALDAQLPAGEFLAVYRLLFNTDAAPTGSAVAGAAGIDYEVQIAAKRANASGFELIHRRLAYPGATRRALGPPPVVRPITVRADLDGFVELADADLVELVVRKEALPFSATTIPVTVVSQAGEPGAVVDSVSFDYERLRWQLDPTLTLSHEYAVPGQTLPYSVSGLTPGAPFTLLVDDTPIGNGTLDGGGAFSGTFTIPAAMPEALRFVTVQETTGAFATSAVIVQTLVFANGFE